MDFADYFWLIWLAVGLVVMEVAAAIWKSEWTLSRHVWKWFAIGRPWSENWAGLRWLILAGVLVSTMLHFLIVMSVIPTIVFLIGVVWSIWYHYHYEAGQ